MTQTLIYTIPYSKHYTGFTQNNSTYFPPTPFLPSQFQPHHPHPHATTAQYKYGSKYPQNAKTLKCAPHEKDNTNTLVEKTKNNRGK
jgi:hypothetical protein